jgi:hypothetical protein
MRTPRAGQACARAPVAASTKGAASAVAAMLRRVNVILFLPPGFRATGLPSVA